MVLLKETKDQDEKQKLFRRFVEISRVKGGLAVIEGPVQ